MNMARVVWFQTTQATYEGWSPMIDAIQESLGRGALGNASAAIAIADTWRIAMVLGGMLQEWVNRRRERQMAEARAEARAETWAEADALLRAWNGRRLDALAKGEPFDEPPPDMSAPSGNGR